MKQTILRLMLLLFPWNAYADFGNAFYDMIDRCDVDGLEEAIRSGRDLELQDDSGMTALFRAIANVYNRQRQMVEYLGLTPTERPSSTHFNDIPPGWVPFEKSVPSAGSLEMETIRLLIRSGADIDAQNNSGLSILHFAAGFSPEIVRLLLNASADIDIRDDNGLTPLFVGTFFNNYAEPASKLECVLLLLQAGADVNARDHRKQTPLMAAGILAQGRYPSAEKRLAQILLESGADVNARSSDGSAPLLQWLGSGHDAVKVLLDAGADIKVKDNDGLTPLLTATLFGGSDSDRTIGMLIDAGADVNEKTGETTALLIAAMLGRPENVKILLRAGAKTDPHNAGITPLHAATGLIAIKSETGGGTFQERARQNYPVRLPHPKPKIDFLEVTRMLVEAGADLNAKSTGKFSATGIFIPAASFASFAGKTPLDFARLLDNREVADYLERIGAKSASKWYWPF